MDLPGGGGGARRYGDTHKEEDGDGSHNKNRNSS